MDHILEKYNSQMQDYCNKVMPHFDNMIFDQSRLFHDVFKRIFDLYLFSSFLVDGKIFPNTISELDTLKVLYSRSSLSLLSIHRCLSSGLIEDASVILRSLLETRITLRTLLAQDTLERIKLYRNYHFVAQWHKLERDKKYLLNGKLSKEQFEESYRGINIEDIEHKFNQVKDDYNPKNPFHWAWKLFKDETKDRNPSIKLLCSKLGLQDDYDYMYSSLSIFSHSESTSEITIARENSIIVAPRFSGPIKPIAYFSAAYTADVIILLLDYFKPDSYEELKFYTNTYIENLFAVC